MAQNFISCDRDQQLLMPPDLREWLPDGHLAWFVLETVGEIDLSQFYAAYRADGWGRAAYEPAMMVALLLYAYCKGERSARKIEERCTEDVGYRVICANNVPDHVTINRFRSAHADALVQQREGSHRHEQAQNDLNAVHHARGSLGAGRRVAKIGENLEP